MAKLSDDLQDWIGDHKFGTKSDCYAFRKLSSTQNCTRTKRTMDANLNIGGKRRKMTNLSLRFDDELWYTRSMSAFPDEFML